MMSCKIFKAKVNSFFVLAPALLLSLVFAGCSESQPIEVTLNPQEIQGSSFSEPAAVKEDNVVKTENQAEATSEVLDLAALATSASLVDDPGLIAKIPNATPAPQYTVRQTTETEQVKAVPLTKVGDYTSTPFDVLSSYKYVEPIPEEGEKPEDVEKRRQNDQIPQEILALNGTQAIIEGWMVPMEVRDDGTVKSFILVKTQPQCCFGDTQAMNEWVDVIVKPGVTVDFNVDTPIKVYGNLEVGEKTDEGFVLSIYRMTADKVEG